MTGYYDYVLGLIPAALIGVTAFLNLVGLSLTAALPAGAAAAAGVMLHAMFVKGPVVDEARTASSGAGKNAVGRSVEGSTGRSTTGGTSD